MTPHCSFLHCYPQKFKPVPVKPDGRFLHCLVHDKRTRTQKVDSGSEYTCLPPHSPGADHETQPSCHRVLCRTQDPHKLKLLRNAWGSRGQCFPRMCLHICKKCEINGLLSLEGHFSSFFILFKYTWFTVCIYRYRYKYTSFPLYAIKIIEYSSLCYTVGPCWLSILHIEVCLC